ncbi:MAG: BamA/TamA family outer membrane protein [Planctomycetia bacterium]|jgi:outer membrane protein insertion porin family
MKRSLMKKFVMTTVIFSMLGSLHPMAYGEEFHYNNKPYIARQKPRYQQAARPRPAPVVRAQIGNGGYYTPSLPPNNASYAPAPNTTTTPAYTPAAGSYTQPAATNTANNNYQSAPTSSAYGNQVSPDWIPGTGPPPLTGDPAGQGNYMPNWGGPGGANPLAPMGSPMSPLFNPGPRPTDLIVMAPETQTGRLMFGVGVNSEAGLVGSIVLDEQNFDWLRFPRSFADIRDATAWRGAGQRFRLEAIPGTEVQRYMVTFQEPYLFGSRVSLMTTGNYYTRIYRDWSEDRVGGSFRLGYHLTHALTGSIGFRGERIDLYNIPTLSPQELTDAAGRNSLYGFSARLAHNTRDSSFMPTEGHLIELGVEQVIGTYKYPKIDLDIRQYFMLRERPDGSGRHVLSLNARAGWSGDDTPIYDHYFAGGFSTIRGFDYRGASPYDAATGVFVGGQFQMLASAEYLFPITADDMLRGVVFCDTGTVQRTIDDWTDKYRVAPGFGLRITVPAMGPAPIALDFAFPVVKEDSDWVETFSFWVGMTR